MHCTYLTIYKGRKLPPFYIGSSTDSKIQKGYHGSVSSKRYKHIWKSELRSNPQLFKTIIISYHNTKKEALKKESYLQTALDVLDNPLYINQSIVNEKFFVCNRTTEHTNKIINNRKGYKHSIDTRKRISIGKKGKKINRVKPMPMYARIHLKIINTGKKLSPDTIIKLIKSITGRTHTEISKQKMRKPKSHSHIESFKKAYTTGRRIPVFNTNMWITNGIETICVPQFYILEAGWRLGRTINTIPPSQKGKFWITNGTTSTLSDHIPIGWRKGRK